MKALLRILILVTASAGLSGAIPFAFWKPAAGGGGGGGTDLTDNLVMLLDADSIAVADGTSLTAAVWQDSHTSNNDATIGNTVTYETNEINGHACVRFTPPAGFATTALNLVAPYTIIVVEKSTPNSDSRTVSSLENNRLISNGRDTIQGFVGGIVAGTSQNTAWCWSALVVPASGNCKFFQNGVNVTTGSITAADWGTVSLGGGFNTEFPASDVTQIRVYDSAKSDSAITTTIDSYISTRYGL